MLNLIKLLSKSDHFLSFVKCMIEDTSVENNKKLSDLFKELINFNEYPEIVELLLKDGRVDPVAEDNNAIKFASENGHTETVKLLLQNSRVDPGARDNYAIRFASKNGHLEIVKLLLQDSRVNPGAQNNCAIRWASENGHLEVVRILLQDSRVDPGAHDNYAITWASENGHMEIVKLLIPRVNLDNITDKKILNMAKEILNMTNKIESNTVENNVGKSMSNTINCILAMMKEYKISKIAIDNMSKVTLEFEP